MPLSLGSVPPPHAAGLIQALSDAILDADTATGCRQAMEAPLYVAYSGGLDSTVLLACAWHLWPHRVRALHVDHGLHPDSSSWATACLERCDSLGIPINILPVNLSGVSANVEAEARIARYRAFKQVMAESGRLLMAHHQDDQLETLLLRLMRGSGLDGLSGMPAQRALGQGVLIRPWLNFSRSDLVQVAEAANLQWTDDPSNADTRFDRNFIRQRVMPLIRERWPSLDQTLGRSLGLLQDANQRLQCLDEQRLRAAVADDSESLPVSALDPAQTTPGESRSLLRLWLQKRGVGDCSESQLAHIIHDVALSADDARGEVRLGSHSVRRFRGRLHVVPQLPPTPSWPVPWADPERALNHPGWGQVALVTAPADTPRGVLDASRIRAATLSVGCRQGGEYCHPAGRDGGRDLKRLLQEAQVPPWNRDRLPLLYAGDTLIAAAGVFVEDGWQAAPGTQGWQLVWRPAAEKMD